MQDRSPSPIKQEHKTLAQVLHPLEDLKNRENELSVKQKELRQLEVKIRKREDDLKIKEAKFKEYENNSSKMELKVENLSTRNKELKNTIQKLTEK